MDIINGMDTESYIREVLSITYTYLDNETVESVSHYLDHAEYEMAFEILFLEIMKLATIPGLDFQKSKEMAIKLNLHKESVFEPGFWALFSKYIELQ